MGQSICRGCKDAVITRSTHVDSNNDIHNVENVVVDDQLDVSQLPIRLTPLIEGSDEDGCDSSHRTGNKFSRIYNGDAGFGASIAQDSSKLASDTKERIDVVATPEEVAELDETNVPIALDGDDAIAEFAVQKSLPLTQSTTIGDGYDAELDKSNRPIVLDDPPPVNGDKFDNKDSSSPSTDDDAIQTSTSAGSITKEERIEDCGFNKNVQLSPKLGTTAVITSLNGFSGTKIESINEIDQTEENVEGNGSGISRQTNQQEQNLFTNKTEKFAIMDLLATDYMRNGNELKKETADNDSVNVHEEDNDEKESLIQKTSSDISDSSGLKLVQTEKFAVYDHAIEDTS